MNIFHTNNTHTHTHKTFCKVVEKVEERRRWEDNVEGNERSTHTHTGWLKGVRKGAQSGADRRGEISGLYTVYTIARQSALRLIHEKDRRGRLAGDLGSYCASREG